jgi:transcription antitermination factor NusG
MFAPTYLPWFAVYVKPRHEKSVALILKGKGLDSFLPTYTRRHCDSKKFELPLFPGYVFCRLDVSKTLPVMTTPGVFSIVGNGHAPQVIPDTEIEQIRRMLGSGPMPHPWPYISAGQQVLLESGPLRGLEGVVVDASDERWLVVSVHLLRRSVAVKMERASLPLGSISSRRSEGAGHFGAPPSAQLLAS